MIKHRESSARRVVAVSDPNERVRSRGAPRGLRGGRIAVLTCVGVCVACTTTFAQAGAGARGVSNAHVAAPVAVEERGRPLEAVTRPDDPPIAQDLRLSRFFRRLGGSYRGIAATENLRALLLIAGGTGVAWALDDAMNDSVSNVGRPLRELGDIGTIVGNPLVLGATFGGMLLVGHASDHVGIYSTGQSLLQGLIVTETLVQATKRVVGRERPDQSNAHSFPSGHSADMAMTATIVWHRHGMRAGIPVTILALAVAGSRVEKHVHWMSDIAAGAGIGYLVGRTVLRTNGLFRQRQLAFTPSVGPAGLGIVGAWSF